MIRGCEHCGGDGFEHVHCGCREAACPHAFLLGEDTDESEGLYCKFWVRRTDGSSREGQKHHDCEFFVLDWDHDPYAVPAALAYADACEGAYPDLAADLRAKAVRVQKRRKDPTP